MVVQDKLIIYLHTDNLTTPSWLADGVWHVGEVEALAETAAKYYVIGIVPAQDILLATVNLPKMPRSRLLQALPYALEEQLISDLDQLHFAVGEQSSDGSLPVAIVAREKMQQWQQLLQSWQVQADTLISAAQMVPMDAQGCQIWVHEISLVRIGNMQNFAIENNNLLAFLQSALVGDGLPQKIYINNFTNHAYATSLADAIPVEENFIAKENFLSQLAAVVDLRNTINLLQGPYASKKMRFPQLKFYWKISAYLAAVGLALLVLYPLVSYLFLHQRLANINRQVTAIYKNHFPQASSVVAPKLRLQEKLEHVMGQAGQDRALLLVGYIGKGLMQVPGIKIKRIDYQNSQLRVDLTAATSEEIAKFSDFLNQDGLNVKQQNADVT